MLFTTILARWVCTVGAITIATISGLKIDYTFHIGEESNWYWPLVIVVLSIYAVAHYLINKMASTVTELFYGKRY